MREVTFVQKNSAKWSRFEELLQGKDKDNPDEIPSLYTDIIDDLSYARTFYPASQTLAYLNQLSGKAHQEIYKNKREKKGRIITFWKTELPEIMHQSRKQLLYAFLIFMAAALVGAFSEATDSSFVRLILSDSYVNMTLNNIENGDPMAVYKGQGEVLSFLSITINNIRVAFNAFVFGIFFSLGTVLILVKNGIMLGSFQYFFYEHGVLVESLLSVWLHGTIEISVIIIAGCAGIIMGNSILFPGTYSRLYAFQQGAKKGLKIVIGTVPLFIIAGFIEGFITRHSTVSVAFDLFLIFASLTLVIWYFIIYPAKLNKNNNKKVMSLES